MQSRQPFVPPLIAIIFGILAVSTASIFIKYALAYAPPLVIAGYRLLIASLVLAPLVLIKNRVELFKLSRRDFILALLSGFFLALHFSTWISSLEYATVASSVVLVSTTPLWVALLSPVTIKEPIQRLTVAGMLFTLVGGSIVGLSDSCSWEQTGLVCPSIGEFVKGEAFQADLLALTGAIMAAAYLIIGRRLRARVSLLSYIFVVYGMAALVLLVILYGAGYSLWGTVDSPGYPPIAYLWFFLLALVPQLLGHSSFNWALGYLSTAYVSVTLLGEPIGSAILAYILLGESPGWMKVFGAILILVGIYLASRSEMRVQKKQENGFKRP